MQGVDRSKLLFGPYRQLPRRRGDRGYCLLRECAVIIAGRTNARTPRPRCRAFDSTGGGSGVLLDERLARAVRHESAAALCYWWGVSEGVVWRWRKALGVGRTDSHGGRRLIRPAAEASGQAVRRQGLTAEDVKRRRRTNRERGLWRNLRTGYHGPRWTRGQLRLLGKEPDNVVAEKVGRTVNAVRVMRTRRGVPTVKDRPRQG